MSALFTASTPHEPAADARQSPPGKLTDTHPDTPADTANGRLQLVQTAAVDVNPHQPRKYFDDASLAELADSLKSNGLIQPIVVRATGDRFELVAGERRLRAARIAGLVQLPAIVKTVDRATQAQWALVENIQREDLNPLDRAMAYRALQEQLGLTQAELARRLGETRPSIANFLRLLDLSEFVQGLVAQNAITLGHAKLLAGVADIDLQERFARETIEKGLSVRDLEVAIARTGERISDSGGGVTITNRLQDRVAEHIGLRVSIQHGNRGGGKVTIRYGSLEELDGFLKRLGYEEPSEFSNE